VNPLCYTGPGVEPDLHQRNGLGLLSPTWGTHPKAHDIEPWANLARSRWDPGRQAAAAGHIGAPWAAHN